MVIMAQLSYLHLQEEGISRVTTYRSLGLPSRRHDVAGGLDELIPFLDTPPRVRATLIDLGSSPAHPPANMGTEDLLSTADHLLVLAGRLYLQALCIRRRGWRCAAARNNRSYE